MTSAELNQAFAREVAGLDPGNECLIGDVHGDLVCVCGWHKEDWDHPYQKLIPDYTKDWNATIAVLKAKGMTWHSGPTSAWVTKGFVSKSCNHLKDDGEYTPRALCLAAIKCVKGE